MHYDNSHSQVLMVSSDDKNKEKTTKDHNINEYTCLLQHNIVSLNSKFNNKVYELKNVLSEKQCANIIFDAEKYAASNNGEFFILYN